MSNKVKAMSHSIIDVGGKIGLGGVSGRYKGTASTLWKIGGCLIGIGVIGIYVLPEIKRKLGQVKIDEKKKKNEHKEDCHCNEEHKCEETCKCEESCKCNEEECSCTEESNINDERELLSKRIKDLEEALLRSQAELINYKRRKDEETSRIIKYAEEDILKGFLPILDNANILRNILTFYSKYGIISFVEKCRKT